MPVDNKRIGESGVEHPVRTSSTRYIEWLRYLLKLDEELEAFTSVFPEALTGRVLIEKAIERAHF